MKEKQSYDELENQVWIIDKRARPPFPFHDPMADT
jgi:hypothetical protein